MAVHGNSIRDTESDCSASKNQTLPARFAYPWKGTHSTDGLDVEVLVGTIRNDQRLLTRNTGLMVSPCLESEMAVLMSSNS